MEEQQIFGDGGAVWDRCIVHGLFSMQPDMQAIRERLATLADGPPLRFEAGTLHLAQHRLKHCHLILLQHQVTC